MIWSTKKDCCRHHSTADEYYTSDYDLSGFSSLKMGLGLRYYPLEGLGKIGVVSFSRLDLRAGYYERSDGLSAYSITLGLSTAIQ